MEDYPSNSNKSRSQDEPKKIEKVVSGPVKTRKKSEFRKFTDVFVSEDINSVKHYIFMDVIVPVVKKAIVDVVSDGVNMLMYGDAGSHSKNNPSSRVSYRSFYDKKNNSDRERYSARSTQSGYNYDDIVLDTRGEAEDVLTRMDELIATYGTVSVADMYDLCGVTPQYTDNKYGWTNIRNASIVRIREGYVIKMPRPLPLD